MGKYKCKFCKKEMIATFLSYQSNQYCNYCFEQRADSTQKQNLNTFECLGDIIKIDVEEDKIKYDFNCIHYFGVISANNEQEAKEILRKNHSGIGDKFCNWSKRTKTDCQANCKLKIKKS